MTMVKTAIEVRRAARSNSRKWGLIALGSVAGLLIGGAVGVAFAGEDARVPAAALTATQAPSSLPRNAAGQTFGPLDDSAGPAAAPDLVLVEYAGGKTGYIYAAELFAAEGVDVASPEEALAWENDRGVRGIRQLTVYASDGETRIGVWDGLQGGPAQSDPIGE